MQARRFRSAAIAATVAAIYFIAGKLGLRLALVHPSATAVWPPTGIALAAFLIFGYRVWPGILLGAFLVNITTAGNVATSIGIAIGNTLEGLVGCCGPQLPDCLPLLPGPHVGGIPNDSARGRHRDHPAVGDRDRGHGPGLWAIRLRWSEPIVVTPAGLPGRDFGDVPGGRGGR